MSLPCYYCKNLSCTVGTGTKIWDKSSTGERFELDRQFVNFFCVEHQVEWCAALLRLDGAL